MSTSIVNLLLNVAGAGALIVLAMAVRMSAGPASRHWPRARPSRESSMEEILGALVGAAEARGEAQAATSIVEECPAERFADGAGIVGPPIGERALGGDGLSDCPLVPGDEALDPGEQRLQQRALEQRLRGVPKALAITLVPNRDDRVDETEAAGAAADTQWLARQEEPAQRVPAESQHQGERETDRAVEEVWAIADEIARRRAQAGHGKPDK